MKRLEVSCAEMWTRSLIPGLRPITTASTIFSTALGRAFWSVMISSLRSLSAKLDIHRGQELHDLGVLGLAGGGEDGVSARVGDEFRGGVVLAAGALALGLEELADGLRDLRGLAVLDLVAADRQALHRLALVDEGNETVDQGAGSRRARRR